MNPAEVHGTYSGPETMPLVADESVTNVELGERIDELRYPEIMADTQEEAPYEFVVEREDDTVVAKDETETLLMPKPIATEFQPFEPQTFEPAAEPQTLELQSAEDQRAEPDPVQTELHHAMAVAAAYFEDSTGRAPDPVLVAGALDARSWTSLMRDGSLNVRDLVSLEDMGTAIDSGLSRAQLGAVCGALRG
jgi:hypothetical protein